MRLSTSLFGLLVAISLVLSGTVYAGFALHKGDIVDTQQRDLRATAQGIAGTLATHVAEKRQLVELGAAGPGTAAFGTDRPQRAVERFLDRTAFDGASIVSADGTMEAIAARNLSEARREALVGEDFGDRVYVREALAGNTYVGEPFVARSGNLVLVVSAPVRRDGRIVGTFNGALHLRRSPMFDSLSRSLEARQSLLVRRGDRVAYRQGAFEESFLVQNSSVNSGAWTITVGEPRSSVRPHLRAASMAQVGAVALAILSIALVGWWVYRTAIGHLNELIDGLSRLEAGDYDAELDVGVTDEWAQISRQFNALADTLDQRESQLRVLNRVLRHNLRNDMSVVIAHADSLIHDAAEDESTEEIEQIRRTARNLLQTSEHARAIYEQLLGYDDLDVRPVDVAGVVESEAERLRVEFPESTIGTAVPATARAMDTDTLPIVVNELARNALLHNDLPPADREVHLAVDEAPGDAVRIRVSDNGPGLPDVEADLLTGSLEETSIEHGSGLGLWVVDWLVDEIDGEVTVRSRDDRGTTVTVQLPAAPETAD